MRDLIKKYLKWKIIIPLFLSAGVIYAIMMTITIPKVMSYSEGMKIFDMIPTGYSASYAVRLLNTLGDEGRDAYLYNQIPLDMIYPLLFGISCCLILAYLLKKLGKSESPLFYICYLPLIAALFDYLENSGIIAMLNTYPDNIELIAITTNVFSIIKSFSTTAFISFLILLGIVMGVKKLLK
jgi:hypothetical protein